MHWSECSRICYYSTLEPAIIVFLFSSLSFFLLLLKENTELNFSLPPQPASLSFLCSPTKVLIMLFPWCAVVFLHRAGIKCPSPCGRGSCIESILCLSCSNIISVTPRSFSPLRDVLPLMLLQWATGTSKTAFFFSFFLKSYFSESPCYFLALRH